jgi:hypothetical protein
VSTAPYRGTHAGRRSPYNTDAERIPKGESQGSLVNSPRKPTSGNAAKSIHASARSGEAAVKRKLKRRHLAAMRSGVLVQMKGKGGTVSKRQMAGRAGSGGSNKTMYRGVAGSGSRGNMTGGSTARINPRQMRGGGGSTTHAKSQMSGR